MKNKRLLLFTFTLLTFFLLFVVGCTEGALNENKDEPASSDDQEESSQSEPTFSGDGKVIEWVMQSSWPSGLEVQRQADSFADKVTEMSGGRLKVKSLTAGSVVEGLEVFDAAENGVIDVAHTGAFYWVGNEPVAPLFAAIPDGLSSLEYFMWLYHGPGLDLWAEMYEDYNFGFVGAAGMNSTENFAWAHKPIESLDDFKGLKFRTVGYWGEIITKLGASVVTLPGGEIYGALERKVLDAAEFANPEGDYSSGLHEVAEYVHVPGIHQPTTMNELLINKDSWEALTPDLQAIVKEAAKAVTLEGLGNSLTKDAEAIKEIEEYGTKIVRLSPEIIQEISKIAHELYEEKSAEDPFFKKVYESQMYYKELYENLNSYMEISY